MNRVIPCFIAALFVSTAIAATPSTAPAGGSDDQYVAAFNKHFQLRGAPAVLNDIASVELYDSLYMGKSLDDALAAPLANIGGDIAWGLAYRMISLNDMFRLTQNPKYLQANLRCINAVLAVRDDRTGTKNFRGQAQPAWSCDKYSARGRAVFLVHTGMIVYPMLDAIQLARTSPNLPADIKKQFDQLLPTALESVHLHDRQWRDGPAPDEGFYIGQDEEPLLDDKPQPANRLSAMGRCLWTAWLITHDSQYRTRAIALGWYIKHRLPVGEDGAYYWAYALASSPATGPVQRTEVAGEDLSHATLSVSFPILLAQNHEVFTDQDMRRFAKTVINGWARLGTNGILFGNITGSPRSKPESVIHPDGWLWLSTFDPEVKNRILPFYLNYTRPLRPEEFAPLLAR